jgi:hypothetical protein
LPYALALQVNQAANYKGKYTPIGSLPIPINLPFAYQYFCGIFLGFKKMSPLCDKNVVTKIFVTKKTSQYCDEYCFYKKIITPGAV